MWPDISPYFIRGKFHFTLNQDTQCLIQKEQEVPFLILVETAFYFQGAEEGVGGPFPFPDQFQTRVPFFR